MATHGTTLTDRPTGTPAPNRHFMQWWREARFGMMIHWGLYSLPAGEWKGRRMDYIGEWVMSRFRIPIAEYALLARSFQPAAFDAERWAALAARAGMKYLIVTAKHHDGFAMYASACDPYNVVEATPFGRDPLSELVAACRRHGVRPCVYYSQALDWHERGGGGFDAGAPNHGGMSWCNDWDFSGVGRHDFDDYFERKAKPQVTELLTRYGPLGAIWFDTPHTMTAAQSRDLYDLVKTLQPECVINSRLGNGLGDYGSLNDNEIGGQPMPGDWETVATLNDTWGYKSFDHNWKSAADVLNLLARSASRNVNFVLNIGPDGNGAFPESSVGILEQIGDWMREHAESVHATGPTPFCSEPAGVSATRRPGRVYLHLRDVPDVVRISGLRNTVRRASLLSRPEVELRVRQVDRPEVDCSTVSVEIPPQARAALLPVLVLDIDGPADVCDTPVQQPDGTLTLPAAGATIHGPDGTAAGASWRIGEDGQAAGVGNGVTVGAMGAVLNWLDPRVHLTWRFQMLAAGTYRVKIVSTHLHYLAPWQGGHRVRLRLGGETVTGVMRGDEVVNDVSARYHAQAVSVIGDIAIDRPGPQELALHAEEIRANDGVGLAVMAVVLAPQDAPAGPLAARARPGMAAAADAPGAVLRAGPGKGRAD